MTHPPPEAETRAVSGLLGIAPDGIERRPVESRYDWTATTRRGIVHYDGVSQTVTCYPLDGDTYLGRVWDARPRRVKEAPVPVVGERLSWTLAVGGVRTVGTVMSAARVVL